MRRKTDNRPERITEADKPKATDDATDLGRRLSRAALHAARRVGECVLVGGLGHADALHTHAEPGVVHHREHRRHAAVLLADEPARRAVVLHHAGGRAVEAELVFEADDAETVGAAGIACRIGDEL